MFEILAAEPVFQKAITLRGWNSGIASASFLNCIHRGKLPKYLTYYRNKAAGAFPELKHTSVPALGLLCLRTTLAIKCFRLQQITLGDI